MSKTYFSVAIHRDKLVIDGVTSIMPNANGFLFQTLNRKIYQMKDVYSDNCINLEYVDDEDNEIPDDYDYIDGIN